MLDNVLRESFDAPVRKSVLGGYDEAPMSGYNYFAMIGSVTVNIETYPEYGAMRVFVSSDMQDQISAEAARSKLHQKLQETLRASGLTQEVNIPVPYDDRFARIMQAPPTKTE